MPPTDLSTPLSSNKVNYLIWRYLQESGFSKAAVELQRAWNPDPQATLPFAGRVQKEWLRGLLALGLEYDEAHERVSNGKVAKRFDLGGEDGPKYSRRSGGFDDDDMYDAVPLPYGTDLHPPGPPGQHFFVREPEPQVPSEPVATTKSKAKSRGRKGTVTKEQRPIDIMEIDTNGAQHLSPAAGDGNASDLASPIVEEPEPPPPTTAEIGDEKHTQSERIQQSIPHSVVFEIAPSISTSASSLPSIEHAVFAPGESGNNALLLAGQNVARMCIIPTSSSSEYDFKQNQLNIDFQAPNLVALNVLAFVWTHGIAAMAAMAIWETFTNELGEKKSQGSIVRLLPGSGQELVRREVLARNVRDVVALEWNASSKSLLSLSITATSSLLRIWRGSSDKDQPVNTPLLKKENGKRFYDAKWLDLDRFILCGESIVAVYEIKSNEQIHQTREITTEGQDWHRVLYDAITKSAVLLSRDTDEVAMSRLGDDLAQMADTPEKHSLPNVSTDFSIHPILNPASLGDDEPRMVAVACETGEIVILDIRNGWREVAKLALGMQKSAEACTWSHDGFLLAAAGDGRVVVWTTEDILRQRQASTASTVLPRAVWNAAEDEFGKPRSKSQLNGVHALPNGAQLTNGVERGLATMDIDDVQPVNGNGHKHSDNESEISSEEADLRHQKLVWHADGKTLIYAMGHQIAIIGFR